MIPICLEEIVLGGQGVLGAGRPIPGLRQEGRTVLQDFGGRISKVSGGIISHRGQQLVD